MAEVSWYVVHTYSGYENKVKANIEKTIENRNLQDQILEVSIPMEEVYEEGKEEPVLKKLFPAYVLIHMELNEDTWYVVRNTRGVTGFVGPGSKPVPLTEEELISVGLKKGRKDAPYSVGDTVVVVSGVWEDTVGTVKAVDDMRHSITINIDMFGRETPVELEYAEVRKM